MSKPVVTILGAGTPFTAALVEALLAASTDEKLPAGELRLFGRDGTAAAAIADYARHRLEASGWSAAASTRIEQALDGAGIVVNQIRFGGLEGRARDEALAMRFQVAADETLGPAALCAALRVAPHLSELASSLARRCPDAWVLNLANPLSVTTSVLVRAGAPRKCVGVCELPCTTALEACRAMGVDFEHVEWSYAGFNHRGFILALKRCGTNLLALLPEMLGKKTIFGIAAEVIARLGAVPLKYFPLSCSPSQFPTASRVPFLQALKASIAQELRASLLPPPSLSKRDFRWYGEALVPMIVAVLGKTGRELVVNCVHEDGLCWELPARVDGDGVHPIAPPVDVSLPVQKTPQEVVRCTQRSPGHWLRVWAAHERAVLAAVAAPSAASIQRALELDPSVPRSKVAAISSAVWSAHRARA